MSIFGCEIAAQVPEITHVTNQFLKSFGKKAFKKFISRINITYLLSKFTRYNS